MADVKIILPDGSAKEYAAGTTLGEAVKQLSNSLAKKVLAANVNGELTDLREELVDGSEVAFLPKLFTRKYAVTLSSESIFNKF